MVYQGNCPIPPKGWKCTRKAGHDGPCAAIRTMDNAFEMRRFQIILAAIAACDAWKNDKRALDRRMKRLDQLLTDNAAANLAERIERFGFEEAFKQLSDAD